MSCHSVTPETPPKHPPARSDYPPKSSRGDAAAQVHRGDASTPAKASVKSAETGILPNTGGPDGVLLIGGVALLAVGGAAVVVARRRQKH